MVKKLLFVLIILLGLYVGREAWFYLLLRQTLPTGAQIASVDVSGLSLEEAGAAVARAYGQPVVVVGQDNQWVDVTPADIGFQLDLRAMLAEAQAARDRQPWWIGFLGYLIKAPLEPVVAPLRAELDEARLRTAVEAAARQTAQPPTPPRIAEESLLFLPGADGFTLDLDASLRAVRAAFERPTERRAALALTPAAAPPLDMVLLSAVLSDYLAAHKGLIGSVFVRDLRSGDEVSLNADLALSGMSIVKIAILVEVMRAVDLPLSFDQQKLVNETAIYSGNYSANLLLDVVAGQDNAYLGVDILTASLQRLGLRNTFIVTPYEEPSRPGRETLRTPANSVADLPTDPDPSMQTTAEEMGILLSAVYECSRGSGALLALYPDRLSAEECALVLDVLSLNMEGNLIRYGVPEGIKLSHKHGWASNTHGDAGVVYSPGGDYVIVLYLTQPGSSWLVAETSFPILRGLSQIVYNYFNLEQPNLVSPAERAAAAAAAAAEAEAAAAAAAEAAAAEATPTPGGDGQ